MRAAAVLALCILVATPLAAQQSAADRLRIQRDSLERIRRERAELQSRMQDLTGRAHSRAE